MGQTLSEAYRVAFDPKQMSKKTINEEASRSARTPKITARIQALRAPVVARTQVTMENRLKELSYAAFLDPIELFDELNHIKPFHQIPEHVRRAIASFKVDPVSLVTEIKFVDKLAAIAGYSKLVGDIPRKIAASLPVRAPQYDYSKLTDAEFKEYLRLRHKARIADAP